MQVNAERPGNVRDITQCGFFFPWGVQKGAANVLYVNCLIPMWLVAKKTWLVLVQSHPHCPPIALRARGAAAADRPGNRSAHTHRETEHPPMTRVYCSTMHGSVRQRGKWNRRMHNKCTRNKCAEKAAEENKLKHREKLQLANDTGMSIKWAANGLQYMWSATQQTAPSWLYPGSLPDGDNLTS